MTPALRAALAAAQDARRFLQGIDDAILPHKIAFQEATRALLDDRAEAIDVVADAEAALRTEAAVFFNQTGNKQPCSGVQVKVFTRLEYDADEAEAYCFRNPAFRPALMLDRRIFEQTAKTIPLPFVRSVQVPMVQLAKELGKPDPAVNGDTEW